MLRVGNIGTDAINTFWKIISSEWDILKCKDFLLVDICVMDVLFSNDLKHIFDISVMTFGLIHKQWARTYLCLNCAYISCTNPGFISIFLPELLFVLCKEI